MPQWAYNKKKLQLKLSSPDSFYFFASSKKILINLVIIVFCDCVLWQVSSDLKEMEQIS